MMEEDRENDNDSDLYDDEFDDDSVLSNDYRRGTGMTAQLLASSPLDTDDDDSEFSYAEEEQDEDKEEQKEDNNYGEDTTATAAAVELEASILQAAEHVEDAAAQRKLVAMYKSKALATSNLPHRQRTYLFYFDYAQNMQCPFFGAQQPGETYYMSPLSINIFGIANACKEQETLQAYCYHEGEGHKGGNNVVSMLHAYLRTEFLLVGNGEHLVLVCGNCGGQNKNRMVI